MFFSLLVGMGASLGLWRVASRAPRNAVPQWLNAGLITLLVMLLGARLGFAAQRPAYFAAHVGEIFAYWQGGLSWGGAALGAWLAAAGIALAYRQSFMITVDRLFGLVGPLAVAAWLGCWSAGVAYGPLLPAGTVWGIPALDEAGVTQLRWPLQPLAAASLALLFIVFERRVVYWKTPGRAAALGLVVFSCHLVLFSFLRADPVLTWWGVRADVWAAVLLLLVSLIFAAGNLIRPPRVLFHP